MAEPDGPVAVVTGAASGMGAAVARLLAARGWRIGLLDLADGVATVADELAGRGAAAVACRVDVGDRAQVAGAVATTLAEFGSIDGLVCCAGVDGTAQPLSEIDGAELDRVLRVNLKGVLHAMQEVVPGMLDRGRGSIVTIASTSALSGIPRLGAYSASKGAVVALTRSAAAELAGRGIRVNSICPGLVRTPMFERSTSFDPERLVASGGHTPMRRVGEAEEIAEAACFLVSDASSYITGTNLVVDGGMTAV